MREQNISIRWAYLTAGVAALVFAGIIYAWSILKMPLMAEFGWSATSMTVNFFLIMCFFCLGGMLASKASKKLGTRLIMVASAVLSCGGFVLTAILPADCGVFGLYLTYGLLGGFGIGMAYNVIVSGVGAWFPDQAGTCSGCLMMGFGASSLVLGTLAGNLIDAPGVGWRTTFMIIGGALGVVLLIVGLLFRLPPAGTRFPAPKAKAGKTGGEAFEVHDLTPGEMVRRSSFWRALLCIIFACSMGNTVISIAKDLAMSAGASADLSTAMVGVFAVCNGLGRILTGTLFDRLGRRTTMLLSNISVILAGVFILASIWTDSLPLCVAGMCIAGLSYGSCPTLAAAFTSAFFGAKNFGSNFSIMNFNLMGASAIGMVAAGVLRKSTGGFVVPFGVLLVLAGVALVLNLSIKRP